MPETPTTSAATSTSTNEPRRLYRSTDERMLAGVAGGLAEYFSVDVTLVRLVMALVVVFSAFSGLLAYLVMWLIIPEKPR